MSAGVSPISAHDFIEAENHVSLVECSLHGVGPSFSLNHYYYEENWLTVNQIYDRPHSLQDINDTHCSSLVNSLSVHHFDHARGMTTVTFSSGEGTNEPESVYMGFLAGVQFWRDTLIMCY